MEVICRYSHFGHFYGMAEQKAEKKQIICDKWGFPEYFGSVESAEEAFAAIVEGARKDLDNAAKQAHKRNPNKTVEEYREGILSIQPLPCDPVFFNLVEIA